MWSIDLGFTKLGRFAAKSVFLNGGADKNWTNSYKKMWFKNRNAKSCFPNPIFLKKMTIFRKIQINVQI